MRDRHIIASMTLKLSFKLYQKTYPIQFFQDSYSPTDQFVICQFWRRPIRNTLLFCFLKHQLLRSRFLQFSYKYYSCFRYSIDFTCTPKPIFDSHNRLHILTELALRPQQAILQSVKLWSKNQLEALFLTELKYQVQAVEFVGICIF